MIWPVHKILGSPAQTHKGKSFIAYAFQHTGISCDNKHSHSYLFLGNGIKAGYFVALSIHKCAKGLHTNDFIKTLGQGK